MYGLGGCNGFKRRNGFKGFDGWLRDGTLSCGPGSPHSLPPNPFNTEFGEELEMRGQLV